MKKTSLTNQVVKNSFWNFLAVLITKVGGVIFLMIVARFLLPENFGTYSLAIAVTMILLTLLDSGFNQTLIRYFSESLNKNKKLAVARYRYLLRLKFFWTIILTIGLLAFAYPISLWVFKKPDLFVPLLVASFYLFVYSFESFYGSLFYVFGRINILTAKQLLMEILRISGVFLVFLFMVSQAQIIGIIGVLIISASIALIILLIYFLLIKRIL